METGNQYNRLSAVKRDIINVNDRVDDVYNKLELLDQGLSPVPGRMGDVENDLATRSHQLEELEKRNNVHSVRLKLLQKEMQYVQLENDVIMSNIKRRDGLADEYPTEYTKGTYEAQPSPRVLSVQDGRRVLSVQDGRTKSRDSTNNTRNMPVSAKSTSHQNESDHQHKGNTQPSYDIKYRGGTDNLTQEEMQMKRRKEIYSAFDSTAINPQLWEKEHSNMHPWRIREKHPFPGGFLFLRFDDSGYDVVNIALKSQQSICRNAGGYLMGISRKKRIFVYESAPSKQQNWKPDWQRPRQKEFMSTQNAIAVFWFTRKEAAEQFFENSHHNNFREPCFPTADGYEAFFVPLQSSPPMRPLDTFLFIEFLDAHKYNTEDMTQFEAEVRCDMNQLVPGCLPMVVSSLSGRVIFKPGVFISPNSKLYVCQFESQRAAQYIWDLGMIQALRHKWNLDGPLNAYSFTIEMAF